MCDTHAHPTVIGDNHDIKRHVHDPPAKLLKWLPVGPLTSYVTTYTRMGQNSPFETYMHTYHHGDFISVGDLYISVKLII